LASFGKNQRVKDAMTRKKMSIRGLILYRRAEARGPLGDATLWRVAKKVFWKVVNGTAAYPVQG
jgi:hypothetical protein